MLTLIVIIFTVVVLASLLLAVKIVSSLDEQFAAKGVNSNEVMRQVRESHSLITTVLNAGVEYDRVMGK